MMFIKKFLNSTDEDTTKESSMINWIELTTLAQIQETKELSKVETVVIFKHSTRCGVSRMVLKQFEK